MSKIICEFFKTITVNNPLPGGWGADENRAPTVPEEIWRAASSGLLTSQTRTTPLSFGYCLPVTIFFEFSNRLLVIFPPKIWYFPQTSKVHTETKQFYTLFNNLSDTKTYLEKHLIRLNSINDNFKKAMSNIETGTFDISLLTFWWPES